MENKSINIVRFMEQFDAEYDFLLENRDRVAGYNEAVDAFDTFIGNECNAAFVREFAAYRKDPITSDREAAAFMFALDTMAG